ncbi:MAG: hypothetical protein AAGF84_04210 [Planctomycetota bacterium]
MKNPTRFESSSTWPMHWLHGDGLSMAWLPGGILRGIWAWPEPLDGDVPGDAIRVNGLLGDPVGGGAMRLLLRARVGDHVVAVCDALREASHEAFGQTGATWRGAAAGMAWSARLGLVNGDVLPGSAWGWELRVHRDERSATNADTWDAILVQDLGLATEAVTRSNEKYVGQYLDLRLLEPSVGQPDTTLAARQGLPQTGGTHPAVFAAGKATPGIMTDLVAFYGTAYKATNTPEHAFTPTLPSGVLQHETPAAILQTRPRPFAARDTFDFRFLPDHPEATGTAEDQNTAHTLGSWLVMDPPVSTPDLSHGESRRPVAETPLIRRSDPPTRKRLTEWFGEHESWRHLEHQGETANVASFFHGPPETACHVVTCWKDDALRRGHGHILRTGRAFLPDDRSVCCTAYQHGVFASQLTVGNTTFGQICSIGRDPINLNRAAGLRLLVDFGDDSHASCWTQLGQAGAFEMAPGWCRWWYVLGERVIRVSAVASPDAPTLRYEAEVIEGEPVRFALRQNVSIGELEDGYATDVSFDRDAGTVTAKPADGEQQPWIAREFPEVSCRWKFDNPALIEGFDTSQIGSYWTIGCGAATRLGWSISASPDHAGIPTDESTGYDEVAASANAYWLELSAPVSQSLGRIANPATGLQRLLDAVPWMTHNAMIHLSVPHGLEQFGGAAWGTRDVCQGPTEMLRAMGRSDVLADVLRAVFRHQHLQTGDWPQWFMHPPFHSVQAGDSHGDVVIWPLYALAHYLEMGGDVALLDEAVPWTDREQNFAMTKQINTIRDHAQRAITRIVSQRIPGTTLPRYGHGDWNDALQPANREFAERMVSSWTVALLADTLRRLSAALPESETAWARELAEHGEQVKHDFQRWCVVPGPKDGEPQVAGILLFDETFTAAEPLLHPADTRTGIRHSLIPMNRALLAGLFEEAQAVHHRRVIDEHLLAPDGARLMERPPTYAGGVSSVFQRAESAAFFGREVGLMYTHAHLRTVESLIVDGQPEAALALLNRVNPVGLTDTDTGVPNAAPRQANAYFSSSDARFATRYDADAHHGDVYSGEVICDGGWRVYSSGPGIFLWLLRRGAEALGSASASSGSDTSV